MWPIYHYYTVRQNRKYSINQLQGFFSFSFLQSRDVLHLLPDGRLRHFVKNPDNDDDFSVRHLDNEDAAISYDYSQGHYCMDKALTTTDMDNAAQFAMVCSPEKVIHWTDSDFLLRKIINPICHGLSMIILLVIAIIYFVLPTLR